MKNIILIIIAAVAVTSCSTLDIQKRQYRSGFYINRTKPVDHVSAMQPGDLQPIQSVANSPITQVDNEHEMDLVDTTHIEVQTSAPVVHHTKGVGMPTAPSAQGKIKEPTKMHPVSSDSGRFDPEQKRILRIVGWILIGFGLVGVIWIFGLILIPIGAAMVILGWDTKSNRQKNKNNSNTGDYVDVVYLKNGSIIRGIIIEQVPNVSIKIQTADGSVFFYKMEEVEKITKEKPIN